MEPQSPPEIDPEDALLGASVVDGSVSVPHAAYRQIKNAERARYQRELSIRAERLGFHDVDAMLSALENLDHQPPQEPIMSDPVQAPAAPAPEPAPQAPPPPVVAPPALVPARAAPPVAAPVPAPVAQPQQTPQEVAAERAINDQTRQLLKAQRAKESERYNALQGQHATESARAARAEQQLAATQEEMRLKLEMAGLGVKDVDYGWFSLSKHLSDMAKDTTPAGKALLAAFDPKAWVEEQRVTRPYIFGTQAVPATTGAVGAPGAAAAPAQPGAPAVTSAAAGASTFNAMTATKKEFDARMAQLGVQDTGSRAIRR